MIVWVYGFFVTDKHTILICIQIKETVAGEVQYEWYIVTAVKLVLVKKQIDVEFIIVSEYNQLSPMWPIPTSPAKGDIFTSPQIL